MVVGSDRVIEFERLLNRYNGVDKHGYYGFDNIEVVSGERDPDRRCNWNVISNENHHR